jgi:hypothetical protein
MNAMAGEHVGYLQRFYTILSSLEERLGGKRKLAHCSGGLGWPHRGVYFFFEPGELRSNSGTGMRVVRVGTHAVTAGSKTTLWKRLAQHSGQQNSGGGNHRGSIFRLIVGAALINRDGREFPTWGQGSSATKEIRDREIALERTVSTVIRQMPFLWLRIDDEPGPNSLRGFIERNAIALLSNYGRLTLDPPSDNWLGYHCDHERVQRSGLWNNRHVNEDYDPTFLDTLADLVTNHS